jgi:hypothetical protein
LTYIHLEKSKNIVFLWTILDTPYRLLNTRKPVKINIRITRYQQYWCRSGVCNLTQVHLLSSTLVHPLTTWTKIFRRITRTSDIACPTTIKKNIIINIGILLWCTTHLYASWSLARERSDSVVERFRGRYFIIYNYSITSLTSCPENNRARSHPICGIGVSESWVGVGRFFKSAMEIVWITCNVFRAPCYDSNNNNTNNITDHVNTATRCI